MASSRAAAADLNALRGVARTEPRVERVVVALLIAALFGALTAGYFRTAAGTDFPEPWTQLSD
jgi:hypothetical protein